MTLKRLLPLLIATAWLTGCADIDCNAIEPYHASRLERPIDAPGDLAEPVQSGTYAIPGNPPPPGYGGGPCLVRPPKTVELPAEEG